MARSQTNTARIDGLRPGMVYVVQVRARTVAGYGKFSGKMCFQTLTDGKEREDLDPGQASRVEMGLKKLPQRLQYPNLIRFRGRHICSLVCLFSNSHWVCYIGYTCWSYIIWPDNAQQGHPHIAQIQNVLLLWDLGPMTEPLLSYILVFLGAFLQPNCVSLGFQERNGRNHSWDKALLFTNIAGYL